MLSVRELARLSVWKARYGLESAGFSQAEARRLVFLQWLVAMGRLSEWPR